MARLSESVLLPSEHIFDDPPPRRPSTVQKCSFCRKSRRACSYSDDMAAAKCKLCLERGLPCSVPQLAPRKRRLPAFPQTEQHAYTKVHANRPESLDAPTAQLYAATEDFSAVSWNVSEIDMGSGDREALLLLCLHSILLMAAEELVRLATALIKPYRRERTLEKTTDALPQLTNTLNTLKDAIRGVGTKIREVGSGYMSLRAHNALSACYFHSNITWGDDEASVKICKDEIAYFQQLGYGTFAYVLQISLMQQQIPMSSGELHDLASNRASFATDIDLYIYSGHITSLLQLIGHQPFTPQEVLHIPAVLATIKADGRPDYLGRSISQIRYDAAVPTSWGKDLQHSDKLGRTALHQALQNCDTTTVHLLLRLGASFGQCCLNGLSPLHISACQGHLDMVKHFLNRTKCMADVHDDFLRTPFYYAAKSSHFELMAMLAARPDVDIDAKDIHELSPLAVAARDGRAKVVKHILKLRSDKWGLGVPGALTEHPHDHRPLQLASRNGHKFCVDLILAHRTWNAGGDEWNRALNLTAQDLFLRGKLVDLYRHNAGVADMVQFYAPKGRKHIDLVDVDFSQHAEDIHGTQPGAVPTGMPAIGIEGMTFDSACES